MTSYCFPMSLSPWLSDDTQDYECRSGGDGEENVVDGAGIEVSKDDELALSTRTSSTLSSEDDEDEARRCVRFGRRGRSRRSHNTGNKRDPRLQKQKLALVAMGLLLVSIVALILGVRRSAASRSSSASFAAATSSQLIQYSPALPGTLCAASDGDLKAGVNSYYDESCIGEGGLGCHTNNRCRFCLDSNSGSGKSYVDCPWNNNVDSKKNSGSSANSGGSYTAPNFGGAAGGGSNNGGGGGNNGDGVLFYDDFSTLDMRTWKHDITMAGGGNWEFQLYRNDRINSYVENGVLNIEPTLTTDWMPELGFLNLEGLTEASECTSRGFYGCERQTANPISSAKIHTRDFTFTKGRLEVRAKLPSGDWLWPAIWLLPKYDSYGMWPTSGEIDVMEARGNGPGYATDKGNDHIGSAMHWGLDFFTNQYQQTLGSYKLPNAGETFADDFHTFGLVRHDNGLYTYVDDDSNRVLEVDWSSESFFERGGFEGSGKMNPWTRTGSNANGKPFVDEEFYIIINLAVGGINYFPDGYGDKPWTNDSGQASTDFWAAKDSWYPTWQAPNDPRLQVDWVKVTEI